MKRFTTALFTVSLVVLLSAYSYSQTPISGPLNGILPVDNYLVTGNIYVDELDSLTIQPGTDFNFQPGNNFFIYGYLNASGTATSLIRFKRADENTPWGHIVFDDCDDNSIMDYCSVEGGQSEDFTGNWPYNTGGGILVKSSNVIISNSTISGNHAVYCGGGLALYFDAQPRLVNCIISNNTTAHDGAGVEVYGCSPEFIDCVIMNNDAATTMSSGGGVACGEGSMPTFVRTSFIENIALVGGGFYCDRTENAEFIDCIFADNTAIFDGGGMYFWEDGWGAVINGCLFTDNIAGEKGGAIYSSVSTHDIENCTFADNSSLYGSGIWQSGGAANIKNNIFVGNAGEGSLYFNYNFASDVSFNDFYNNSGGDFGGAAPLELGVISGINRNGTPCDDFANIFENPSFVDAVNGDYHLQAISACIDAGAPSSGIDPDGTIKDQGCYYFDQGGIFILMEPDITNIQIPATGGAFEFSVLAVNQLNTTLTFDFWIDAVLPNGSNFGPISLRTNLTLTALDSIFRDGISQNVPASAPAGGYNYCAKVGEYPDAISNFSMFTFEKLGSDGGTHDLSDWNILGWEEYYDSELVSAPGSFELSAPYPNPFNPETTIAFEMGDAGLVKVAVYDVQGREVSKLADGYYNSGSYQVEFFGGNLPSGMYFVRMETGGFNAVQKMLLLK